MSHGAVHPNPSLIGCHCAPYEVVYECRTRCARRVHIACPSLQEHVVQTQRTYIHGSCWLHLSCLQEHAGAEELRARVAGMSESLGRMLGSVERNRALMALMNSVAVGV